MKYLKLTQKPFIHYWIIVLNEENIIKEAYLFNWVKPTYRYSDVENITFENSKLYTWNREEITLEDLLIDLL